VTKLNKKLILILILPLLILGGVVFAFQKNVYSERDNKDLLEEFGSDRIKDTQINKNYKQENQKQSIAQTLDFIAKIGKDLFGVEKKSIFQPVNKMVELKNFKAPKIINVPEDYSEIQTAIDDANFGDTIKVASGEYLENIIMKEGVSLIGSNEIFISEPDEFEKESTQKITNETIINGGEFGNVVSFKDEITNKTSLANFTIKNSGKNLSGIFIENSSPVINNNILKDNEYGIYIKENSSPVVQKNIINFNNKGIQVYNFIEEENQNGSTQEHGANNTSISSSIIIDNLITDNKIGIDLYNSSALINHNTISYNNHYKTYLGPTFGIYIAKSSVEIKNNIITDNGICDLCAGVNADEKSANVILSYNNIWNNKSNFVCFGECVMEDNNFSEDPMFVDYINGDFRLKEGSGLIGVCENESDIGVRW
jgi:parallel beta-helix repeat protein